MKKFISKYCNIFDGLTKIWVNDCRSGFIPVINHQTNKNAIEKFWYFNNEYGIKFDAGMKEIWFYHKFSMSWNLTKRSESN